MARTDVRLMLFVLIVFLLLLLYLFVGRLPYIQNIYPFGKGTAKQDALIVPVDTKLKEPRVFRWTGKSWEQQVNFCNSSKGFKRAMLKTGAGETPMFVHDDKDDVYVSATLARTGRWDGAMVDSVMRYLMKEPKSGLLDVGSQLGVYTLTAAKMGWPTMAVDPLLKNVKRLCRSATEGGLADKVTIVYAAISDARGTANFDFQKGNVGRTVVLESNAPKDAKNPNVIETVLLDDLIPLLDITSMKRVVMKVDVEGHEFQAMSSAKKLFHKFPVPYVHMEWDWHKRGPKRGEDMTEYFKKMKYVPHGEDLIDFFTARKFVPMSTGGEKLDPSSFRKWGLDIVWAKQKKQ